MIFALIDYGSFRKALIICNKLIEEVKFSDSFMELANYHLNTVNISMNLKVEAYSKASFHLEKSKEINKKRETLHKLFALKATIERLDLLNDSREKKIGVEMIDLKENNQARGTKVVLRIPILK